MRKRGTRQRYVGNSTALRASPRAYALGHITSGYAVCSLRSLTQIQPSAELRIPASRYTPFGFLREIELV
ncbi:MAG: hypothetical protein KKD69_08595 [Euryarchaeota archaeon]|nr:hypothetical protein [Euryarchaeota archaeon]MCG2727446.1 hypothetical protein [Candidatus Methanoperedenaceae archaeon]